jgi:hypothetical protein
VTRAYTDAMVSTWIEMLTEALDGDTDTIAGLAASLRQSQKLYRGPATVATSSGAVVRIPGRLDQTVWPSWVDYDRQLLAEHDIEPDEPTAIVIAFAFREAAKGDAATAKRIDVLDDRAEAMRDVIAALDRLRRVSEREPKLLTGEHDELDQALSGYIAGTIDYRARVVEVLGFVDSMRRRRRGRRNVIPAVLGPLVVEVNELEWRRGRNESPRWKGRTIEALLIAWGLIGRELTTSETIDKAIRRAKGSISIPD